MSYEEELEEQLENTVRTIYFYEQSYLVDWLRAGVIQKTIDLDALTTVPNYCIHFDYRLLRSSDEFNQASGQLACNHSVSSVLGPTFSSKFDPQNGLSFPLYKY